MRDRDRDLIQIFVRDLDGIDLPPREAWRPAPRKESVLMKATGYVIAAATVAAVLIAVLVWSLGQSPNPVSAPRSSSPTPTPTPATSASASATLTASAATTPKSAPSIPGTGAIAGDLGYPSEMVPRLTVYAINVNDPNVWFSVQTPQFGGGSTNPTPRPPSATPEPPPVYTLPNVAPGTYYVIAYIDQDIGQQGREIPGAYTRYTVDCIQKTRNNSAPPACSGTDHSLVPVTVQAGQTVTGIDIKDWYAPPGQTYPPRPKPR